MIHLYDIRDALVKKFGGGATAQKQISISSTQWKRMRELANDKPFRQSRHRGKFMAKHGQLQNASQLELVEAGCMKLF